VNSEFYPRYILADKCPRIYMIRIAIVRWPKFERVSVEPFKTKPSRPLRGQIVVDSIRIPS